MKLVKKNMSIEPAPAPHILIYSRKKNLKRRLLTFLLSIIMLVSISTSVHITFAAEMRTSYPDPYSVVGYRSEDGNIYPRNTHGGNCTWYAWGRCYEVTGVKTGKSPKRAERICE